MLLLAVVSLLVLGVAGPAAAHTLSKQRAGNRAWVEAELYGEASEWHGTHSCVRRTAHRRRCVIWSYNPRTDWYCDAYVGVRFRSRRSYRTVAGDWVQSNCFVDADFDPSDGRYEHEWIWISSTRQRERQPPPPR